MEQKEFTTLLKDLITHLYDYTVLETHPLVSVIVPPLEYHGSRGEYLRQVIEAAMEALKPQGKTYDLHMVEWRPYIILQQRYLEGLSLAELSQMLSLSERQIRRDNSRALQALAGRLWDQLVDRGLLSTARQNAARMPAFPRTPRQTFEINPEMLDLGQVIQGVAQILHKRLSGDGLSLQIEPPAVPVQVMADRVVMRQILISLVSYLFNFSCQPQIRLRYSSAAAALVEIQAMLCDPWSREDQGSQEDLLETTRFWSQQLSASIELNHPAEDQLGEVCLRLSLPLAEQPSIMVVDDQKPTQQMFRRFLSRTPYQIIGVTDPDQVLSLARQLRPALITLDVMMPKVDGWEILQALQTDAETRSIPVLVCSAWEEPELAKSLGAADFLKKPIRQQDLLAALARLGLA